MSKQCRRWFYAGLCMRFFVLLSGILFASEVLAGGSQLTLTGINSTLGTGIGNVVKIMQDIATVAGVGFIFAAFFKFHQHKMQPTQVPLSQGVVMLVIGAGLTVFPHLLGTASKGVFGQSVARVGGTDITAAIGS